MQGPSEHELNIAIGQKLAYYRKIRGMTTKDLASIVGISYQQIQKHEKAVNRINAGRLILIADALCISPDQLLDTELETENERQFITNRSLLRLTQAYSKIKSPKVKKYLMELVYEIASLEE